MKSIIYYVIIYRRDRRLNIAIFFSARRRFTVDFDREETNIINTEKNKHQIEQH